ncbi:D-serine ammonia-lyase [Niallia sp. Krafla_26]|uniref:D-serine ammonia-lyase n=1 Tax=Niallia sp. Krafla_26 TaxID=3064703 RepID=UPI003D17A36D
MKVEINELVERYPILQQVMLKKPVLWENPDCKREQLTFPVKGVDQDIIEDATERLRRFKPLLQELFPELNETNGEIISPLTTIPNMKEVLQNFYNTKINGSILLKRDDLLPIAGSIKARGGFHEVLAFAETLALDHQLLQSKTDDYRQLSSEKSKALFKQYHICVGSTGNLGLSIGMISSSLGFNVTVHMSQDAKKWKKELLRHHGVKVVEYQSDYSVAVEKARNESEGDPKTYFVDDENSIKLFAGYSVAARELKNQLDELGIKVDDQHHLYVYLPCGVGGGPGGITYGLKSIFGKNVSCYFAEPIHSPCMLLGLLTKLHHQISVQDFQLDNLTEADGLAVGKPSKFVGELMEDLLNGIYTISDEELLSLEYALYDNEKIFLEPSALAGMKGPVHVSATKENSGSATHIVWATGGSLVPDSMKQSLLTKGKLCIKEEK